MRHALSREARVLELRELGTIATVRVKPQAGVADTRPTRDLLARAAKMLEQRGFEILRIGRFGVSIVGEPSTFSRELGVEVIKGGAALNMPKPRYRPLAQLIDLVEVTTPPTHF
jgi:hypothetical protein